MKLYDPQCLNEIGGRNNNEDAIYPDPKANPPTADDRLFVVCDGVGGQEKGEIASRLAAQHFFNYANENPEIEDPKQWMEEGLRFIESKIEEYLNEHGESRGMATTLTVLYLSDKNGTGVIGWVGDSRVYHVRDGETLFQTKDHSLVQGLIDHGEITEDEVENHPQKNIITRAVNGTEPSRIDVKVIDEIAPNDYFFLCTDGILENIGKNEIGKFFLENESSKDITDAIMKLAKGNTKDNFSMYLIKVEEAESIASSIPIKTNNEKTKKSILTYVLIALILLILGSATFFFFIKPSPETEENNSSGEKATPENSSPIPKEIEEDETEKVETPTPVSEPDPELNEDTETADIKHFQFKGEAEIWGLGKIKVEANFPKLIEERTVIITNRDNSQNEAKVLLKDSILYFIDDLGDTIQQIKKSELNQMKAVESERVVDEIDSEMNNELDSLKQD